MTKVKKRVKSEGAYIFGPEPTFTKKIKKGQYNSTLIPALQWYGQYGGANTPQALRTFHKAWLKDWALANGFKRNSFTIPNQGIATYGALARVALRGFPISKEHIQSLKNVISEWKPEKKVEIDYAAQGKLLSLKAKIKNEQTLSPVLTVFDGAIDAVCNGAKKWSLDVDAELSTIQANELKSSYKSALSELKAAYNKTDDELVEAYPYPRLVLRRLVAIHEEILEKIRSFGNKGKAARQVKTARKKKVKPASALIKKLKYLPVCAEYALTSVDPEKLVGATVAYLFDTKKRHLKQFTANGVSGFEVSGTTIKNATVLQKTLRKPYEQLSGFSPRTTESAFGKMFEAVRSKAKPGKGRVNADMVILAVY